MKIIGTTEAGRRLGITVVAYLGTTTRESVLQETMNELLGWQLEAAELLTAIVAIAKSHELERANYRLFTIEDALSKM